ncbi:hypothetical protein SAMN05421741_11878 [Paenimyroides ummariense]|uniref:Uncharacterized protein n=1 Tax=Paenimyroides ummariense TaxID=913024 RepID=A0A1I5E3I8_9FLAO|nr:hypothetical protein [Paenimyroides ummariense]SFO06052.1 hypothetical protein SAMN05421741_11878 [Paenimyroides ummariense]
MHKKLLPFSISLFCLLGNITKSHAQREIHPLDPMFTYDYALKYYGNLTLYGFWSLENFKAPKDVQRIEQYESFYDWNDFYRNRDRMLNGEKNIYYYNKETGFLERSIYLDRNHKMKSTHFYSYKTDSLHLTISIKNNYFARDFTTNTMQYIYDVKTENLLEIRHNNDNKDFIKYTYDKNQKDLTGVEDNSNWRRQEITISYDTLKPIDKIKYFYEIGNNYKFKNDSVYLNKEHNFVNVYQRKFELKTFATGHRFVRGQREYYDNLSKIETGYNNFSPNHIFFSVGHNENYPAQQKVNPSSIYYPQTGTFLFDEDGKLFFVEAPYKTIYRNIFSSFHSPEYGDEESLSILEKKNDNQWGSNTYNKVYLKKNPLSFKRFSYHFKTKRKQKKNYKIKNGSIYKDNKPIIIYNYYN